MRVAELLGSLSLATDLADGFALEKSLRTTALACRLARVTGADDAGVRAAFWATLLRFAGCTAFAHEEGRYYGVGEDIALRRALAMVDFGRPATFVSAALRDIATHAPFAARATALGRLVAPPGPRGGRAARPPPHRRRPPWRARPIRRRAAGSATTRR